MSFLVVVACLCVQWFLNFTSAAYQWHWVERYDSWMRKQFTKLFTGHPIFVVLALVLPIVILTSLVFTIIYHVLGHLGYSLASLVLLWYCVDVTGLRNPAANANTTDLFLQSYQKVFALLFWYFAFGPVGLTLYVAIRTLHSHLGEHPYFAMTQGVLDWVPIRLLGLAFSLVSNFGVVFKGWRKSLLQGISTDENLVVTWGQAGLSAGQNTSTDAVALIRRALLLWLVVMALVVVGSGMR